MFHRINRENQEDDIQDIQDMVVVIVLIIMNLLLLAFVINNFVKVRKVKAIKRDANLSVSKCVNSNILCGIISKFILNYFT